VIAVDQRGFGWSDAPAGAYRKEDLALDLVAVLDALGLDRVGLIGHDWGGWVGFLACLRFPERFTRFAALNIPPPFFRLTTHPQGILALWYQVLLGTPLLGPAAVRSPKGFVPLSFRSSMRSRPLTEADIEIYASVLRDPARARATSALYRTFITRELWEVVAGRYRRQRLKVPTRILFGVDDVALSPKLLEGVQDYADDVSIELIQNAGHFVAEEQPELVNRELLAFFGTP
jgi:pimeloyl-ACP methyl ester carboxylesterase